jgi:hypothetical protein
MTNKNIELKIKLLEECKKLQLKAVKTLNTDQTEKLGGII